MLFVFFVGHIWKVGNENDELKGVVLDEVSDAFLEWYGCCTNMFIFRWELKSRNSHRW